MYVFWARIASQLSIEHISLKETVDSYQWRDRQKKQREAERAELFRRANGLNALRYVEGEGLSGEPATVVIIDDDGYEECIVIVRL